MISIRDLINEGVNKLETAKIASPLLDVQLLLCHVLEVDKVFLYCHMNDTIDLRKAEEFNKLLEKRYKGCPLQYIINKQEFMGLDFYVDENVLIPRPDTEILVEKILEIMKGENFIKKRSINIADIGSGSGAIGLSLAKYETRCKVHSVDISENALKITASNSESLEVKQRVKLYKGDMLSPLLNKELEKSFDIIVSNPPYIPSDDIDSLQIEVSKYEPRLALDGGLDGLEYYRQIINTSPKLLAKNGVLAFEIGWNQGEDLKKLLKETGEYKDVEIIKDLANLDRVVIAVLN